jgi:Mg2+ and Co2+ transporter CorA
MAAWLPIIKIVLPYLAPVFHAALPVFTKKKSEMEDPLVAQQIGELQEAVKTNSESTKALAKAIEEIAQANDRVMRRVQKIAVIAVILSGLALALMIVNILT